MTDSEAGREYWQRFAGSVVAGKYELFGLIGVGASSGVFRAEQRSGNMERRDLAVKLIERPRGAEPEPLAPSLDLKHPNVLRCYEFGETILAHRAFYYLVMERADYSLVDYLSGNSPSPTEFRRIFLEIARGLHYLHTHPKKYVHRDIKRGNVLWAGNAWKIGDFGIMESLSDPITVTIRNPGTLQYMSPEANEGMITTAWDIWSLGVLMVHCLTREYPFRQTQGRTLAQSIRENDPYFAVPIPPPFEAVIRGCLNKNYAHRWTAAQVIGGLASSAGVTSLDDMELIHIPAGEFAMGSSNFEDERPVHRVYLDDYAIAKTPVMVRQYRRFCTETGYQMPPAPDFDPDWKHEDHPIVNVSWFDAMAYCDWLSQAVGKRVSLPTEAQWENAARGTDDRMFPWGNTWDARHLQCGTQEAPANGTAPAGSFPSGASFYGVLDMAGNVWEWCADSYDETYYQECAAQGMVRNPLGPTEDHRLIAKLAAILGGAKRRDDRPRVLRGGCWAYTSVRFFRCAYRYSRAPLIWGDNAGFRYVMRAESA